MEISRWLSWRSAGGYYGDQQHGFPATMFSANMRGSCRPLSRKSQTPLHGGVQALNGRRKMYLKNRKGPCVTSWTPRLRMRAGTKSCQCRAQKGSAHFASLCSSQELFAHAEKICSRLSLLALRCNSPSIGVYILKSVCNNRVFVLCVCVCVYSPSSYEVRHGPRDKDEAQEPEDSPQDALPIATHHYKICKQ